MVSQRRSIRDLVGICSALYVAWLAFTPELARASCAAEPLSTVQARADVIVLGQVTQTTEQDARFVVHAYIKGRGPHELNVTGRNSPDPRMHTSVDFIVEPGQRYLLFLTGSPLGLLRTDACAGNREGATALTPEELTVLGQGVPPDPAIADPTRMPATEQPRPAPALNDGRSSFNGQAAAFLLLIGMMLVGFVVFIVMRKWRRVH